MSRHCCFALLIGLLVASLAPAPAMAEGMWDARVEDTIAGFGTEVEVRGEANTKFYVGNRAAKTDMKGKALVLIPEGETEEAGMFELSLEDNGGNLLATATYTVFPDVPAELTIEPEKELLKEGEETIIHVGIFDQYKNPIPGRPLLMLSSDGSVEKIDSETGEDGFAAFAFTPGGGGEVTVVVADLLSETEREFTLDVEGGVRSRRSDSRFRASLLEEYEDAGTSKRQGKQYGFVEYFDIVIESPDPVLKVNEAYDFSIIARDRNDRRVEDYVGRVVIETTDSIASTPQSAVRFHASDRGQVDLPLALMFGTPGEHKIFVEDQEDGDIRGAKESVWVVGHGTSPVRGNVVVESHRGVQTISSRHVTITGTAPAYINLDLFANDNLLKAGSSDADGRFSFAIALDAGQTRHEMIVREGAGGLDRVSEPFTIVVDAAAPTIQSFVLIPPEAAPGAPVTVSVTTEAGEMVEAIIGQRNPVPLAEKEVSDGVSEYEASFAAPDTPGSHTVTVVVRDQAGNDFQQSKPLLVQGGGLAIVQNLEVRTEDQHVVLTWDAVAGATEYRIYFGIGPQNLSSHIDTGSAATSARLTGLAPGKTTYFAVTGLDELGGESAGQSALVSATPRGSIFDVQVFGTSNGAHVQWVTPPGAAIRNYTIQFGVQPGAYTESRIISASSTRYELSDLINGVTYYVLLSALQSDGTFLTDRAESAVVAGREGQPGMQLAPHDPLPGFVGGPAHGVDSPRPPSVPETGLPWWLWFVAALLGVLSSVWFHLFYPGRRAS